MELERQHIWDEDTGGYYCEVCGADHSDMQSCLGPAPFLSELTPTMATYVQWCAENKVGPWNAEFTAHLLARLQDYYNPRRNPLRVSHFRRG